MKLRAWIVALSALLVGTASHAAGFTNGGFEDGNLNGWTIGGGSRSSQNLSVLNPNDYLPGGTRYNASIANHSAVVTPGQVEGVSAALAALMPNRVYSGGYSLRVEDTTTGGYVSVASQSVSNYTEANIFFAWLAVLENGGHSAEQSAAMVINLRDDTTGTDLITRVYNAVGTGGGVDSRFNQLGSYFYTPQWQIEQLAIDASLSGHDFTLTVLASDCAPTAHEGFIYLDGFGSVTPPSQVPEPSSMLLAGVALMGLVGVSRRRIRR